MPLTTTKDIFAILVNFPEKRTFSFHEVQVWYAVAAVWCVVSYNEYPSGVHDAGNLATIMRIPKHSLVELIYHSEAS